MKNFLLRPENFSKFEFWAATTIYVFLVFFHISDALSIEWVNGEATPGNARSPFNYFFISNLIRYTILYGAFLLMTFVITPRLVRRQDLFLNIILVMLLFVLIGTAFGATNTFLRYRLDPGFRAYGNAHNVLFQKSFLYAFWLLLMFGFYSVVKYTGLYFISRSEAIQTRYRFITPGGLTALVLWMITLFFFITGGAERGVVAAWALIVPSGIFFYWFAFYSLIPRVLPKRRPFQSYMFRTFGLLFVSMFPVGFVGFLLSRDEIGIAIATFNAALHLFVTAPLTWVLYKRYLLSNEEISFLKKELGQSHASFDFLRSQINPHFLFNALNTIYGTALQEKAERTSEGIEKLGDMMRFMLQENMQEKISLSREIDYLDNYIGLQRLRTDSQPTVKIDAHIEQRPVAVQISPMLLIPFVENAFKHGISFREPSHIRINMEMRDKTLYFDVYNSKHAKQENDPEKNKSGIGLKNVKQRLQLLYPGKHELIIRETGKEFFVHLTLQLS